MTNHPTEPRGTIVRGTDQDFAAPRGNRTPSAPAAFRLDLRRAYAMHRKTAWITGLAVFALVVLYGMTRPRVYEAEVVFYVSPVTHEVLSTTPQPYDDMRYTATIQQLTMTMQRMDVAQAAVKTLPEGVWRHRGESVASAAIRMINGTTVARAGTSFQMTADLQGSDPEGTTAALNALAKAFMNQVKAEQLGSTDQQVALLTAEQTRVSEELANDRAQQVQLSTSLGFARLNTEDGNPLDASVNELQHQLIEVQRTRELGMMQSSGNGGGGGFGNDGMSTTSGLITSLNTRKAQLESQMAGMTPANPIYQQNQVELALTEKELVSATARSNKETQQRDLERQATMRSHSQGLENELRAQLASQRERAAKAAPQLQQYAQLNGAIERLQARSNAVDESLRSIALEREGPGQIRIVVPPQVPTTPLPGKRKLLTLASIPLALIAAMLAAAFAHNRDRRLFLSRDVEQILGFKPMAVLPVASEVSQPVQDAYLLRLAAAIENSYRNGGARSFVFTSPSADTDVEEMVFALQQKLKQLGYSALWVGSDTLLRAEKDFEEAYGRGPQMSEEARLTDKGMDGLAEARLAWLQRDYDMVLVDAPPLTCSAEAEYAVRRCDATIIVNESGVTTRDELQQAGEILERIGLGGVGTVVKDLHLKDADILFQNSVRLAEADNARRVAREPRDDAGTWQILHQGTARELMLPGDPVARQRRRVRSDRPMPVRVSNVSKFS